MSPLQVSAVCVRLVVDNSNYLALTHARPRMSVWMRESPTGNSLIHKRREFKARVAGKCTILVGRLIDDGGREARIGIRLDRAAVSVALSQVSSNLVFDQTEKLFIIQLFRNLLGDASGDL